MKLRYRLKKFNSWDESFWVRMYFKNPHLQDRLGNTTIRWVFQRDKEPESVVFIIPQGHNIPIDLIHR